MKGAWRIAFLSAVLIVAALGVPPRAAAATTYFSDNFNVGSSVDLGSHTPSTVGTSWTKLINNGSSISAESFYNAAAPPSNASGAGSLYEANGTYSGADYSITANDNFSGGDSTHPMELAVRIADANNLYMLRFSISFFQLWKRVAGTWTQLASETTKYPQGTITSPYQGDVVGLQAIGTTISATINGTTYLSVTDSSLSSAGEAGIGIGYVNNSSDAAGTGVQLDNVLVQSASTDTTPPTVSLTAPVASEATSSTMTLAATASDDVAVAGVTFYVDGTKEGSEVTSAPYKTTFNSAATTTGTHTAFAVARDSSNNYATSTSISFTIDNVAPSVSLAAPMASEATSSIATLAATASDANSGVAGVKFYVDGTQEGSEITSAPYSVSWDSTATSSGAHAAFAVARDAAGNYATSSNVSFTVSNTGPTPSSVNASPTTSGATITWSTAALASSRVYFGPSTAYGSSTPEVNTSPKVTSHSVALANLIGCTTYHYVVVGRNAVLDTATSSDATFTMLGCTGNASVSATGAGSIATSTGGTLTQGALRLTVPMAFTATSSVATFQANQLASTAFFAGAGMPTGQSAVGTTVFNIKALTDATTTLSTFTQPLTVTLSYSPSDVAGLVETSLKIYRYDSSSWTPLSNCSVDTSAHTVTCNTSNFSDFAIFGQPVSSGGGTGSATGRGGTMIFGSGPLAPGYQVGATPAALATSTAGVMAPGVASSSMSAPVLASVPAPTSTTPLASSYVFSRWLERGMSGSDVKELQMFLNRNGFAVASSGFGSPGQETTYFGSETQSALAAFQTAHAQSILAPAHLTKATGVFGAATMSFINAPTSAIPLGGL